MSLGRIFAPRAVTNANSKLSGPAERSFAPTVEGFGESKSKARTSVDLRSVVQRRFMSMMESHDRMRARVLGSTPTNSYPVSGD
jgi:hypothetical protein